jgi:hypothetical protein
VQIDNLEDLGRPIVDLNSQIQTGFIGQNSSQNPRKAAARSAISLPWAFGPSFDIRAWTWVICLVRFRSFACIRHSPLRQNVDKHSFEPRVGTPRKSAIIENYQLSLFASANPFLPSALEQESSLTLNRFSKP